jgi:hypothetical protein
MIFSVLFFDRNSFYRTKEEQFDEGRKFWENVHAVAWDKEIKAEYSKIKSRVKSRVLIRLHHSSEMFYTAFPAVNYPHFRVDTKKKVRGGHAKAWKAPIDWLAHCRHWKHLAARMAFMVMRWLD